MKSVAEEAERLRRKAVAGPIGKRHSSFELYDLLGDCMALVNRCQRNPSDMADLEKLFLDQPVTGQNRRYLNRDSDEYILVCRYVFATGAGRERSNASRYAHALREASKRQLVSDTMIEFLKTKGGINALFLNRPLAARSVTTKCLRLTKAITVPKHGTITLTLRRTEEGSFEVLENDDTNPPKADTLVR